MRSRLLNFAALVLVCATSTRAADKRVITPEDIADLRWVAVRSMTLSPDATQVAYVVIEWDKPKDKKAKRKRTLWLVPVDGDKPPRRIAPNYDNVSEPQWSSDGRRLAFLSVADASEKKQIHLWNAKSTKTTRLTDFAEGVLAFEWSPDGSAIAFTAVDPPKSANDAGIIEVGTQPKNRRLWVVAVADRKVLNITDGKRHVSDFTWSPDGKQFLLKQAPSTFLDDVYGKSALVIVDRKTKKTVRSVAQRVAGEIKPQWSPDGKTIAFAEFTPKHIAKRLALVPAGGGKIRHPLNDYRGTTFWKVKWSTDSRHLWVQTFETTRNRLLRLDTKNNTFERVAVSVQNFWEFDVGKDEKSIILNAETGKTMPDVHVYRKGQTLKRLTHLNPQIKEWRLGDVREVKWKSKRDGRTIYGVLVTPAGFKPGKGYPTIVELHGGPQGMWWSGWLGTYLSRGQLLASRGFVVFLPNPRGSIGQGWRFVEAVEREWGGNDYHDVMDGVDYLIEQKVTDPQRMAVGGQSYGGFLTAWTTTQTDRFRAAVVDSGISDLTTMNLTSDVSLPFRHYFGGLGIRNRRFCASRSPLSHVEKCKTPTLVLHGEKDTRVPMAQGRAWHRALKLLGVETQMVVYSGAGHLLTERAHQLDNVERVVTWYEKHVKP